MAKKDEQEEEGRFREVQPESPPGEEAGEVPTVEIDVEPIRQLLRREIYVVRQELRQEIRQEIRAELHIGPLPHPDTLAGYERIVPGAAERIIKAFEEQGEHRRYLERYALKLGNFRSFAGLACGFVVTMVVMFLSYQLIQDGHGVAGTILATVDLVGLVGVFVYGSHVLRDERLRKTKIMTGRDEGDEKAKKEDEPAAPLRPPAIDDST